MCSDLSPLISYCGSSGVAWWVYPLRSTFFWLTPVIVPVTRPASEFQTTWSPTLNLRILSSFMALVEFRKRRRQDCDVPFGLTLMPGDSLTGTKADERAAEGSRH